MAGVLDRIVVVLPLYSNDIVFRRGGRAVRLLPPGLRVSLLVNLDVLLIRIRLRASAVVHGEGLDGHLNSIRITFICSRVLTSDLVPYSYTMSFG
jgi:hypothetical protein